MTHRINIKHSRGDNSKKPMSLPDLSTLGLDIGVKGGRKRTEPGPKLGGPESSIKKATKSKPPVQHGSLIDYIEILIRILRSDASVGVNHHLQDSDDDEDSEDSDITYAETRSLTLKKLENLKNELKVGKIGTPHYQTTTQWNNWIATHVFLSVSNDGLNIITSIKRHAYEIWRTHGQTFVPLD